MGKEPLEVVAGRLIWRGIVICDLEAVESLTTSERIALGVYVNESMWRDAYEEGLSDGRQEAEDKRWSHG